MIGLIMKRTALHGVSVPSVPVVVDHVLIGVTEQVIAVLSASCLYHSGVK